MKKVFQTITDKNRGDCHRASIASLFDLEIEQVPHFRLFNDETWGNVFSGFIWGLGYDWTANGELGKNKLLECDSINGYFEACVPSANYPDRTHSVIIDLKGLIVHDPHPKKAWLGKNVLKSGDLKYWSIFKKQKIDEAVNS